MNYLRDEKISNIFLSPEYLYVLERANKNKTTLLQMWVENRVVQFLEILYKSDKV
jgi:hypothetical protein